MPLINQKSKATPKTIIQVKALVFNKKKSIYFASALHAEDAGPPFLTDLSIKFKNGAFLIWPLFDPSGGRVVREKY